MKMEHIEEFSQIPQPPRESFGFIEDIRKPLEYHFRQGSGCPAGKTADCMESGAEIVVDFPAGEDFPETAFVSLRRVLKAKGIEEKAGGYLLHFAPDASFAHEEYEVRAEVSGVTVTAGDGDGLRRAVYYLEDRICEAEGKSVTEGRWRRKPYVKHRVSRCFFGPTNRPPFFIDELTNDVDYYPEEYLNKLAHEGVNGLWLTMYFRDLPSSVFPGRGKDAEKRFAKLRLTVERCARYGIRIYVFLSEPKYFGDSYYAMPLKDSEGHPELLGGVPLGGKFRTLCTSSAAGKKYLSESTEQIFRAVPGLGGVINIMFGEDNGSCVSGIFPDFEHAENVCPICMKQRDYGEVFREQAEIMTAAMHKYNPKAEYIGWFYAPGQRDGSTLMKNLLHVAEKWPENSTMMLNFESGGASWQLDKKRIVFDYSLAYVGPSELFARASEKAPRMGAKLQVGCSHEDASVPFIPVPENLYDKYHFLHDHGVSAVMQCWYFGNYPGLMNKAAGELSFEPFCEKGADFLTALARPEWGKNAPQVAQAWHFFSEAYRKFPSNIDFEWFGPLHHSIVWPLYLFPVDKPIAPSWILENFPAVSGDRIGECLGLHHTLAEGLELCTQMSRTWRQGVEILNHLEQEYEGNLPRLMDIGLARAVGLQMASTENLLRFYDLREDMLYNRKDHLGEMEAIVRSEIKHSEEMLHLCEKDSRLGYHSEAEGYLFFPEKLRARIRLLEELLSDDFPKFDLSAGWIDEYTGRKPVGPSAVCAAAGTGKSTVQSMGNGRSWSAVYDDAALYITLKHVFGSAFQIELEPVRLWPSMTMFFSENGDFQRLLGSMLPELPEINVEKEEDSLTVRVPLAVFDGFRRPGFPMRINVHSDEFHWLDPRKLPPRLIFADYNPEAAGWLIPD